MDWDIQYVMSLGRSWEESSEALSGAAEKVADSGGDWSPGVAEVVTSFARTWLSDLDNLRQEAAGTAEAIAAGTVHIYVEEADMVAKLSKIQGA